MVTFGLGTRILSSPGKTVSTPPLKNVLQDSLNAEQVFEATLKWATDYKPELAERLKSNRDYVIQILNIERNIGKKSRKDLTKWEDVEPELTYFFDDLYRATKEEKLALLTPLSEDDIRTIANDFIAVYQADEDKDTWFNSMKEMTDKLGYCSLFFPFHSGIIFVCQITIARAQLKN